MKFAQDTILHEFSHKLLVDCDEIIRRFCISVRALLCDGILLLVGFSFRVCTSLCTGVCVCVVCVCSFFSFIEILLDVIEQFVVLQIDVEQFIGRLDEVRGEILNCVSKLIRLH